MERETTVIFTSVRYWPKHSLPIKARLSPLLGQIESCLYSEGCLETEKGNTSNSSVKWSKAFTVEPCWVLFFCDKCVSKKCLEWVRSQGVMVTPRWLLECFSILQKEWREDPKGVFKKKVARCVRRSQEMAYDWGPYSSHPLR